VGLHPPKEARWGNSFWTNITRMSGKLNVCTVTYVKQNQSNGLHSHKVKAKHPLTIQAVAAAVFFCLVDGIWNGIFSDRQTIVRVYFRTHNRIRVGGRVVTFLARFVTNIFSSVSNLYFSCLYVCVAFLGRTIMLGWRPFFKVLSSSPGKVKNLHFTTSSKSALGPTQPSIQWIPRVKRQGREADHSSPTSSEVKKTWVHTFTPPYVFMV
jgi:hypothetical protein